MHTIEKEEGGPLVLSQTYLRFVENSVGSNMFRDVFVSLDGIQENVTDDGDLSCAVFVSSVLKIFSLIQGGFYTTIDYTIADMLRSGWSQFKTAEPGAVVLWESKVCSDNSLHRHIGICLDTEHAVSNCPIAKAPVRHRISGLLNEKGEERGVECFFRHPSIRSAN